MGSNANPSFSNSDNLSERFPIFILFTTLSCFWSLIDLLIGIHTMATINFAESIDTVQTDLAEIQPTIFPAVPRILEKMHSGAMVRMKDASLLLKKTIVQIFNVFG